MCNIIQTYVLRFFLKTRRSSVSLIYLGRPFHILGAYIENPLSTNVFLFVLGTLSNFPSLSDHKFRIDVLNSNLFIKYSGAFPCRLLWVRTRILKSICACIGSQCNCFSDSLLLDHLSLFNTSLAAMFLYFLHSLNVPFQYAYKYCICLIQMGQD